MSGAKTPIRLSIAVPAYNEDKSIEALVHQWWHFLKAHPAISCFEIVICNDGSQDETGAILDALALQYPQVKALHFKQNQGAAAALAKAIAYTQFEWVLLTDADGQFPIENVTTMVTAMHTHQVDGVLGSRNKKDHWFMRLGTKASGLLCNLVHGSRLSDFNTAFKLISGPLLRSFVLEAKGMNYSTEITSQLLERKATLIEIMITHEPRMQGESSMRMFRDSFHRFLFVCYLSLRQLLLKLQIIRPIGDNAE